MSASSTAAELQRAEVDRGPSGGAKGWIDRYAAAGGDGWFKLDSAQRSFETHLASLEVDIDPAAIASAVAGRRTKMPSGG